MPRRLLGIVVAIALAAACARVQQAPWLGTPETIAPGVDLFRVTDSSLTDPQDSIAVYLLQARSGARDRSRAR